MEVALAESLFHDGVEGAVRLSPDALDGPYGNTRFKLLDNLAEDSRQMKKLFRTVKTINITLISTFHTIDPQEDQTKPLALAQNTAAQIFLSY